MPAIPTRTLNPLPFEHLEPKRFEDLVRQLAYDFKPWRQLEATGRGGSDDGFDARGFEIILNQGEEPAENEDGEGNDITILDRIWLIQCKRERVIGPAKMQTYLDEIPAESRKGLYGILFAAACDFSKKTRDVFRLWCSGNGLAECHIWGKAEVEDLLFQPKNDHLLFAYFGISLQIRKQKAAVNLRRNTTIKRKLKRIIEGKSQSGDVILRDISDDRYPEVEGEQIEESNVLWRLRRLEGLGIRGLQVLDRKYYAYFDTQTGHWDLASKVNHAYPDNFDNPWPNEEKSDVQKEIESQANEFWISIPERYRAEIRFVVEVPYSEILEVDDLGDSFSEIPTVFVTFKDGDFPILARQEVRAQPLLGHHPYGLRLHKEMHLRIFPDYLRDIEWEDGWSERNSINMRQNIGSITLEPPPWLVRLQKIRAGEETDEGDDTAGAVTV